MIYTDFHGEKLSLLGFGTMRLPLVPGGGPADIDEKTTADMVRYAMDHGVNYFDTAYPYHGGMSERVIGRVLKDYDRQSFYLEAEGYEECTIAGYSGIMKQTLFYGYVSSYLRLKITESTNYDVYATTYVDDSVLTDPVELAAATNTMKNDPDTYYQKSLELLEAMLTAAEFREPVDSWFE